MLQLGEVIRRGNEAKTCIPPPNMASTAGYLCWNGSNWALVYFKNSPLRRNDMYRCVKKTRIKGPGWAESEVYPRKHVACLFKEFTPNDSHALTDCPIVLKSPPTPCQKSERTRKLFAAPVGWFGKELRPRHTQEENPLPPLLSGTLHMVLYCSDLLPHAAGNEPNSPAFTLRAASLLLRFPRGLVGTLPQHSFTSSMIGGTSFLPPWPTALLHLLFSLAFPSPFGGVSSAMGCSFVSRDGLIPLLAVLACLALLVFSSSAGTC